MKSVIINIAIILMSNLVLAQLKTCLTIKDFDSPTISPSANSVAVSTRGLILNEDESIEFNNSLPFNNWEIKASYNHGNADNAFRNSIYYWNINSGILTLKLYDIANDGYDYTTAILTNQNISNRYGYYETKIKMPNDEDLCISLWGAQGTYETDNYREIDAIEHFTSYTQSNIYHNRGSRGGRMYVDPSLFNSNTWYVFGIEWLPSSYSFYINNNYIGSLYYESDCIEENLENMNFWKLWIVNWIGHEASGTFPKELKSDYIRIYSFNTSSINSDFYNNLSSYDYSVWKTIHIGDIYFLDAKFDDNGRHAIRATDSFTLGAGFEVVSGTEFETILY